MFDPVLIMLFAAVAGGIGAALRFVVDGAVMARVARKVAGSPFPLGILLVNLSGSLMIGLLTGLASNSGQIVTVFGIGLLGGYTTFSTASVDTVRLLRRGRPIAALANGPGQMLFAIVLAGLGFWLGKILVN
ncbi:CrcB family protein [Leucobacter sp. UT-8R-CII-1-4]|uniref:fluoride efflux transporter FluC n=1 Tax=Leucobacter sp. UT-8R-CII-1-4 TaxID=3040075 RepID=UPI0024A8E9DA|nr:CrcB family protein [Leucobacter sp. UT-8R-CII-1-4]MDI6022287.1 CrcB family protein [Leucobacter sp. UT-8R-CII-1-4]